MAVADFNGDGNLDLATVSGSFSSSSVSVLLGKGDGTFAPAVNYSTAYSGPVSVVAADFNKDGKIDLGVLAGTVSILLGNGDGTFQSYTSYSTPNYPARLLAADFNGKGNTDLAVLGSNPYYYVAILTGDGRGHFAAPATYYAGIGPAGFVAADFDQNGSADLAVTNAIYSTSTVTVMLNEAVAALSRGVLNFPKTAVGSKSTVKKVQFSNPGTVAVGITSISVTGADSGDFAQTSTCGNSLAVGKSCTVSVDFQPTQKGKRSAVLTFNDTALGGLQAVPLAGTAY